MFRRFANAIGTDVLAVGALFLVCGDTSPFLHRPRLLGLPTLPRNWFEDNILEKSDVAFKMCKAPLKCYQLPEVDASLNHMVNVGLPKLLDLYKKEAGQKKAENLKAYMDKFKWEVCVDDNMPDIAKGFTGGKIVLRNLNQFQLLMPPKEIMKFTMCHEAAHSICRHGIERITNFAVLSGLLFMEVCLAFILLPKLAALGVAVAGGAVFVLFELYQLRRQEYEADCVALLLFGCCGWHPDAGLATMTSFREVELLKGYENALEWIHTHPLGHKRVEFMKPFHARALLLLSGPDAVHEPEIKVDVEVKALSDQGSDVNVDALQGSDLKLDAADRHA